MSEIFDMIIRKRVEMVIERIDQTKKSEIEPATLKQGPRQKLDKKNLCVYYPEVNCLLPKFKFRLCQSCRRARQYLNNDEVKTVFDHIKSMAITMSEHFGF